MHLLRRGVSSRLPIPLLPPLAHSLAAGAQYVSFFFFVLYTSKALPRCRRPCVSICTFIQVKQLKQVNEVPALAAAGAVLLLLRLLLLLLLLLALLEELQYARLFLEHLGDQRVRPLLRLH